MAQNVAVLATKYVFVDLVWGVVGFPVWWYTAGVLRMAGWAARRVRNASRELALGVWVKNLFVPMYGETGAEGRIISFFMRLAMVVLRGIAVGVWAVIVWVAFLLYLLLPIAAVSGILFNLGILFL